VSGPQRPAEALPDAVPHHFALKICPPAWRPFLELARIDRPIGWWLLLLPCWWSNSLASIAAGRPPHWRELIMFLVGAIAMRGAGATYNDILDRDIDAKVERTRGRPLPSGRISVRAASLFMLAEAVVGALALLSFNRFAILVGLASLAIVAVYPLAKRITFWPQAVLGLAFAWGGLIGWAAASATLPAAAWAIYAAAIFWTIGYDTIYAIQDARDDPAAGVRSTARLFGAHVRLGVGLLYVCAVGCAALALYLAGGGWFARLGLFGFALHLAWQVKEIDPASPRAALKLFRSNRDAGLILFCGLLLEAVLRAT
jgi:4-hydroxybenzoate polyprenyltransferase